MYGSFYQHHSFHTFKFLEFQISLEIVIFQHYVYATNVSFDFDLNAIITYCLQCKQGELGDIQQGPARFSDHNDGSL